jgi:hypothetical protein
MICLFFCVIVTLQLNLIKYKGESALTEIFLNSVLFIITTNYEGKMGNLVWEPKRKKSKRKKMKLSFLLKAGTGEKKEMCVPAVILIN